jgi:hypothetical protein
MTRLHVRPLMALACIPLVAFTCAPSPTLDLVVRPASLNQPGTSISVQKAEFPNIEAVLSTFASRFEAARQPKCSPTWWWERKEGEPCAFFSNYQKEGVMTEVFYDAPRQAFRVVLVKDLRTFGQHTTEEVENAFSELVVKPLQARYGTKSVQIDGRA